MPRFLFRATALAVLASAIPLLAASADDEHSTHKVDGPSSPGFKGSGSELFRALLNQREIKPVAEGELHNLVLAPDLMAIILGSPHRNGATHQPHELETPGSVASLVLSHGGSVLIVSSENFELPLIDRGSDWVNGKPVTAPLDVCWERTAHCPFARPFPVVQPESLAVLFNKYREGHGRLDRVVAGNASFIERSPERGPHDALRTLASFPAGSVVDHLNLKEPGANLCFAVGADAINGRPNCRFLALACRSVFNNYLMALDQTPGAGTDNLEFCLRVIDFLQGEDSPHPAKRRRCVFFEDGRLVSKFDDLAVAALRQQAPPLPRFDVNKLQEKVVDETNRVLDKLQTSGLLTNLFKSIDRSAIMSGCLIVSGLAACWFLLSRLIRARGFGNAPPAPVIAAGSDGPPGVFDNRRQELLRRNNVYEPIRDLLRDFFAGMGIVGEQTSKLLGLKIARGVRRPDSLRLAIQDLWRLAYGPPQTLPINRWLDMAPYFDRIRAAYKAGKWSFIVQSE